MSTKIAKRRVVRLMSAWIAFGFFACSDNESNSIIPALGNITALVNLDVDTIESARIVPTRTGSLLLMIHTGAFVVDQTSYGVPEETRFFALGFDPQLRVAWIRDYGIANQLTLLDGHSLDDAVEVLFSEGALTSADETTQAPAILRIALADGVAAARSELRDPRGELLIRSLATHPDGGSVVGGQLIRTKDDAGNSISPSRLEAWAARYTASLSKSAVWSNALPASSGASEFRSVTIDSLGNVYALGTSESPLEMTSRADGTFVVKLGASLGEALWARPLASQVSDQPIASTNANDLVLTARAVEPDAAPAASPLLLSISGTDGTDLYQASLGGESADVFSTQQICRGLDDATMTIIGEFVGTLETSQRSAVVTNQSIFFLKVASLDASPRYLRWSSSTVDVALLGAGCETSGGVYAAGLFTAPIDGGDTMQNRVFVLRLSP